jgi:6-pyruvoyltetrahydropterin/6-carboxytetrahydropterin synthase
MIHGHNWGIALTFGCHQTDPSGFVVDFGELHYIRDWLDAHLDHACLFNADDPLKEQIVQSAPTAFKTYILPSCSSEGIAEHLFAIFNPMVQAATKGRAFITQIEIFEDSKNSATYAP